MTADTSEGLCQDIVDALAPSGTIGRLYVVPFGERQREISLAVPQSLRIIMYRRVMLQVAERIALLEGAKALVANGCYAVAEGANMPSTPEAVAYLQANGVLFAPAKASNAGGVATSGLEMSQNSLRLSWTFEEVDERLKGIMKGIFHAAYDASVACDAPGNLMVGANVAGFIKVADSMIAQGIAY